MVAGGEGGREGWGVWEGGTGVKGSKPWGMLRHALSSPSGNDSGIGLLSPCDVILAFLLLMQ